jgi:DNA-binding response OmpR family regulator
MAYILLLEPDQLLAGSIISYFANAQLDVSAHAEPQSAIYSADKRQPDAVIVELQLASRSGVEFLYEFRSYPEWQNTPLIIFTNLQTNDLKVYAEVFKELNIAACLHKSSATIGQLLEQTQSALQIAAV